MTGAGQSIADRFPEYDLTLPAWLADVPDHETITNPTELARTAAAEDLAALQAKVEGSQP